MVQRSNCVGLHRLMWLYCVVGFQRTGTPNAILASVFQYMIPAYHSSHGFAMSHFAGDVLAYSFACLISKLNRIPLIELSRSHFSTREQNTHMKKINTTLELSHMKPEHRVHKTKLLFHGWTFNFRFCLNAEGLYRMGFPFNHNQLATKDTLPVNTPKIDPQTAIANPCRASKRAHYRQAWNMFEGQLLLGYILCITYIYIYI